MKIVWVNAWYDPGKEGDSAKALIDQGADIIAQHTDSGAPLQVAQQRGVLGFGQASDMISLAPKAQLTASVDFWDAVLRPARQGRDRRHLEEPATSGAASSRACW